MDRSQIDLRSIHGKPVKAVRYTTTLAVKFIVSSLPMLMILVQMWLLPLSVYLFNKNF